MRRDSKTYKEYIQKNIERNIESTFEQPEENTFDKVVHLPHYTSNHFIVSSINTYQNLIHKSTELHPRNSFMEI